MLILLLFYWILLSFNPVAAFAQTNGSAENIFGVMPAGSPDLKIQIADSLHAVYIRPADINTQRWQFCPDCNSALTAGIKLIITVRNGGGGGIPSYPPDDLEAYKVIISSIIARYSPEILVVENEENDRIYFYSGTPQQYLQQLAAACLAAHQANIPCTNGGLVSKLVILMVANSFNEAGQTDRALDYLRRSLPPEDYQQFIIAGGFQSQQIQEKIRVGVELAAGYRSAGADYINFHWYTSDPAALPDAVQFLEQISGLPALTNEVGQQSNEDPDQVTGIMAQIFSLDFPYAVWFSQDIDFAGNARALTDLDGTLRPNGIAFRQFIIDHFELTQTPTPIEWISDENQLLAGDVNNDNKITIEDIAAVIAKYTDFSVPVPEATPEDVNNDQLITIDDIALTLLHWTDFVVFGDE